MQRPAARVLRLGGAEELGARPRQHDWVLIIDADERVPEALAREILTRCCAPSRRSNGFYIRRENVFLDKVIRHSGWSTDKVVRLFRRDKGRYPNRRVHADLEIEGPAPVLQEPVPALHLPLLRPVLRQVPQLRRVGRGAGLPRRPQGRRRGDRRSGRAGASSACTSCSSGFLDGLHGLVLCALQAFGVFLKYACLWEYRTRERLGEDVHLPAFDDDARTWHKPD